MQRFIGKGHLLQKFDTCRTAFLCCDIQDRLRPHIKNFQDAVDVSNTMSQMQQLLGDERSVFVTTEQAPQYIGHTAKDIRLPPGAPAPFGKMQPSMLTPDVLPHIVGDEARGRKAVQQAVLWGHETHVCVAHTADDLLSRGIRVAVLCDGCASQQELDHAVSLQTMAPWEGLVLTTVSGVAMQLCKGDARLVKDFLRLVTKGRPRVTEPLPPSFRRARDEAMQAQMMLMQAAEHYTMLDFANTALGQCWEICYERNLSRAELSQADIPDAKLEKMDACGRKCVNREFEVFQLMQEGVMKSQQQQMQQMGG